MQKKLKKHLIDSGIHEDYFPVLGTVALIVVAFLLFTFCLASPDLKDILLSFVAMFFNAILAMMQLYIMSRVYELKSDHIKQYDVEKVVQQLLFPEQTIQILLTVILFMNSAWMQFLLQLPLAVWHIHCFVSQKTMVKAVLGKSEEFAKSITLVQRISMGKAALYTISFIWCFSRIYTLLPSEPPPRAGWSLDIFLVPSGITTTPYGFDNLVVVADSKSVPVVDMSSESKQWLSFQAMSRLRYSEGMTALPAEGYAWRFFGKVAIRKEGLYTFCTESDDGSLFFVDLTPTTKLGPATEVAYTLLVDNDGLHGRQQRCKDVNLMPGYYNSKLAGFESGGGMTMRLLYRGPDTNDNLVLAPSVDGVRPAVPDGRDGWTVEFFTIPHDTQTTPGEFPPSTAVGENRHVPAVQLDSDRTCSLYVPGCPEDWFAWRFYGRILVHLPGEYTFCTESDDGSLFYMDLTPLLGPSDPYAEAKIEYTLVIDNDGQHSPRQRCKIVELDAGRYHAKVVGFEAVGMPLMTLKYKGPDTDNQFVWTRSCDSTKGA